MCDCTEWCGEIWNCYTKETFVWKDWLQIETSFDMPLCINTNIFYMSGSFMILSTETITM